MTLLATVADSVRKNMLAYPQQSVSPLHSITVRCTVRNASHHAHSTSSPDRNVKLSASVSRCPQVCQLPVLVARGRQQNRRQVGTGRLKHRPVEGLVSGDAAPIGRWPGWPLTPD